MEISLNNDKTISLLLSNLIPIIDIRINIIKLKNKLEKKDALEYHIERWENISSKYFRSFESDIDKARFINSYVINKRYYIAYKDKNLDFYNETGISYQVRSLLIDIINCPCTLSDNILDCTKYEWRKEDDDELSYLAKCIMNAMKE